MIKDNPLDYFVRKLVVAIWVISFMAMVLPEEKLGYLVFVVLFTLTWIAIWDLSNDKSRE